ncbi:hypothetical protein CVT26_014376 [Gymnopilus dilepis]|uniref:Uncharacterized protein n=1 Tax=Gymnopilus dilepis TaxID=231916 RepID=A0A409Y7T9_9AGAR|nr:hypothetical protein CVT26_014376 [Gymnopilus dilepis]
MAPALVGGEVAAPVELMPEPDPDPGESVGDEPIPPAALGSEPNGRPDGLRETDDWPEDPRLVLDPPLPLFVPAF